MNLNRTIPPWKQIKNRMRHWFLLSVVAFCSLFGSVVLDLVLAAPQPLKSGSVAGAFVVKDGGTMSGGQVLFFNADDGPPPLYAKHTRVPDQIIQVDAGNNFAAILPVGNYYLLAVKRRSGEILGPPAEGDYGFRFMDSKGAWKAFAVQEGKHIDLGSLPVKFKGKREKAAKAVTAITGFIGDAEGKAVDQAVVLAFSTPQMQGNRPQFLSSRTGKDGEYILHVDGNATYYLMARGLLGGGQVAEGEIVGIYGSSEPAPISVKAGATVKGIDIKVAKMGHRGPDLTAGSTRELDPAKQKSKQPEWLPSTLPGSLQKENITE